MEGSEWKLDQGLFDPDHDAERSLLEFGTDCGIFHPHTIMICGSILGLLT